MASKVKKKRSRELIDAVLLNDLVTVRTLLEEGASGDIIEGEHGATPLMLAAERGYEDIAEELIAQGADPNARDREGRTPLMYAKIACLEILVRHGGDINAQDQNGETALIHATKQANTDKVQWLVRRGADIAIRDTTGFSAFDYAQELGIVSLCTVLHKR